MASLAVPAGTDNSGSSSQSAAIRPALCPNCHCVAVAPGVPSPDAVSESWGHTQMQTVKFKFTWTIHNFSFCEEENGDELSSPLFSAGSNEELKWRILAYPYGRDDYENHLSLFLNLVSCYEQSEVTAVVTKYEFSILNCKGEKTNCVGETARFAQDSADNTVWSENTSWGVWGFADFIKLDFLLNKSNGLLPDDNLTVLCEGTAAVNRVSIPGFSSGPQVGLFDSSLSDDFCSLFENQEFSDVILSVGSKDLLAHKAVLAARSAVFAAMFKCEMNESKQNRVDIVDIEYSVVKEMLTYIYTGKSPNLATMAEDLLAAADKYDLGVLKKMCETFLLSLLTVENAVDLMVLADMHCAKLLKALAIQFINKHVKDVMLTPVSYTHLTLPTIYSV